LTESENALRYLAHLGGNAGVNRKRKKISQGVDEGEIWCKMVSSLGHYGATGRGKGKGAEADPDDL
jgi:hypothetical protein